MAVQERDRYWGESWIQIENCTVHPDYQIGGAVITRLNEPWISKVKQQTYLNGLIVKRLPIGEADIERGNPLINVWIWYKEHGNSVSEWEIRHQTAISYAAGTQLHIPAISPDGFIDPSIGMRIGNYFNSTATPKLNCWQWWDQIVDANGKVWTKNLICPYATLNTGGTASPGNRNFLYPSVGGLIQYLSGCRNDWGTNVNLLA